jgi:hypothetical protein
MAGRQTKQAHDGREKALSMRGLNSRSFLWQWDAVYASSNPGHLKDRWTVDGVDWTKERHAYWGGQYSVQLEVHRLEYRRGNKVEWQLLVIIERWWGPDRQVGIRNTSWCKLISGKVDSVQAWLRKQPIQRTASVPAANGFGNVPKNSPGQ